MRKNLTLSPGLRYEVQTHVRDYNNVGPRIGVTWAPFASGQTTLRASAGLFYDWLPTSTYQQALQVDGVHQQEVNVVHPSFPTPGTLGESHHWHNRYLIGSDYRAPETTRIHWDRAGGLEGRPRRHHLQLPAGIAAVSRTQ